MNVTFAFRQLWRTHLLQDKIMFIMFIIITSGITVEIMLILIMIRVLCRPSPYSSYHYTSLSILMYPYHQQYHCQTWYLSKLCLTIAECYNYLWSTILIIISTISGCYDGHFVDDPHAVPIIIYYYLSLSSGCYNGHFVDDPRPVPGWSSHVRKQ